MSEEKLRQEAVRRRLAGENAEEIAQSLGRTSRWVRKWVTRHGEDGAEDGWSKGRSRAPRRSPTRTSDEVRVAILAARERLVANPRAQYGPLAVQWELRRLGVDPVPPRWTVERVLAQAGVTRPRRRQPGHVSRGAPYPTPVGVEPGTTHQVDLIGPRHLFGGVEFHALNLIDVGSHEVANDILEAPRPGLLAASLVKLWARVGVPSVAQFDNHANFRGGIQPAWQHFGPVVATCLDLGVTPRFIPLREPWRNGVVEHFNDVWDKSFFRTETFTASSTSEPRTLRSPPSTTSTTATPPTTAPAPLRCGTAGSGPRCPPATSRPAGSPPEDGSRSSVTCAPTGVSTCSASGSWSPRTTPTSTSPPSSRSEAARSS